MEKLQFHCAYNEWARCSKKDTNCKRFATEATKAEEEARRHLNDALSFMESEQQAKIQQQAITKAIRLFGLDDNISFEAPF